jgi:hypothetical protein
MTANFCENSFDSVLEGEEKFTHLENENFQNFQNLQNLIPKIPDELEKIEYDPNSNFLNNLNFTSTILPSDLNNFTDIENGDYYDFSHLSHMIPFKGDDVKSSIAYLDMVTNFCNSKKENNNKKIEIVKAKKKINSGSKKNFKQKKFKTPENKNFSTSKKILRNKPKVNYTKFFYVRKVHKKKCVHHSRKNNIKVKRNKIKNFVNQDLEVILKSVKENTFQIYKRKSINYINKLEKEIKKCELQIQPSTIRKNQKNRKFRLFDKDVIIKKIVSNFIKFLKLMYDGKKFDSSSNEIKKINDSFKFNFSEYKKICSIEQIKEFLKFNFDNIVINNNKANSSMLLNDLQNISLQQIFSCFFLTSKYFQEYLINKIKSSYDSDYLLIFLEFIKKIL